MNDEEIRWKKIKCCCSKIEGDVEHQHPIGECMHCKCQEQEDSMPRNNFKVNQNEIDKDGNSTDKLIVKEIKEINIVRGQKYHDVIGWTF
tara:strand:- start:287 stop:556 length:270 start_codon:yes stop_codon:yes gene_type:complete